MRATFLPAEANLPASVLPALPYSNFILAQEKNFCTILLRFKKVYEIVESLTLFSQKNRLHDFIDGLGYLLLLSCVILDRLQRKQYFSFVEKKQHDFISSI